MPYPIHRYASNQVGAAFLTLNDREINTSATSLRLLGRFTPNYGESLNENLLWLLENFASPTAPSNAISGQLWFDSATNTIKFRDQSGNWRETAQRIATATAPTGSPVGQIWFNTANDTLNYRDNGGSWQEVVRQNGPFTARYADVAERYASSEPLESGDVVEIGGPEEIRLTRHDSTEEVFGVISTNPAIRLNAMAGSDETHPFVALSGRVPCKVVGPIRKGQRLVASEVHGVARAARSGDSLLSMFGRSLVDDDRSDVRLVEIVLGSR